MMSYYFTILFPALSPFTFFGPQVPKSNSSTPVIGLTAPPAGLQLLQLRHEELVKATCRIRRHLRLAEKLQRPQTCLRRKSVPVVERWIELGARCCTDPG